VQIVATDRRNTTMLASSLAVSPGAPELEIICNTALWEKLQCDDGDSDVCSTT